MLKSLRERIRWWCRFFTLDYWNYRLWCEHVRKMAKHNVLLAYQMEIFISLMSPRYFRKGGLDLVISEAERCIQEMQNQAALSEVVLRSKRFMLYASGEFDPERTLSSMDILPLEVYAPDINDVLIFLSSYGLEKDIRIDFSSGRGAYWYPGYHVVLSEGGKVEYMREGINPGLWREAIQAIDPTADHSSAELGFAPST